MSRSGIGEPAGYELKSDPQLEIARIYIQVKFMGY